MIEDIKNPEFLSMIKKGIKSHGTFMVGVTPAEKEIKPYIYTIGHKERGRPDFMAFCVTDADFLHASAKKDYTKEIEVVKTLIDYLVDKFESMPILPGHTAEDFLGRNYIIYKPQAYNPAVPDVRSEFMLQASNYYGSYDYEVLVLQLV